ncbi:MAG TPA: dihydrofolate reductase family protein [Solirubrobacteraceae bacterium]|nr:dihydrofolate reductase family protein [Solirubrobacteraceae bacterium]
MLRRLLPEPGEVTADALVQELRAWELAPPDRPHVAVNMVHTCDGRASVHGRTGPISSLADRQLFHALRTRVDAVMVGAGTLRVERYGRMAPDAARREQRRAAGLEPDPLAIVVSGSLDLPPDLPLLQDPASRVVIVTAAQHSLAGVRAHVEYLRSAPVDLHGALATLRDGYGVRAILCEGGPYLNASLIAQGLIDELFLTTVPVLAGAAGALSIMDGAPLQAPLAVSLRWMLAHEAELFARYAIGAAQNGCTSR